jgi:hypothetical protein
MSRPLLAVLALTLWVTAVGCGDDDVPEPALATFRVVTAAADHGDEYRFEVPESVPEGPTRIELVNEGREPHHAQVFRLDDGAAMADLEAALATGEPAALLEVGGFVGGTALVSPGGQSRADAVLDLEAGDHALLCFVPDAEGVPHLAHGMVRPFEVTATGETAAPPSTDGAVALGDYRFTTPSVIDGDNTLEITNRSDAEAHELVLGRFEDGATAEDVVAALDRGEPVPATGVGGMQALLPGATQRLQLDLPPGRYVAYCAIPSPDGTPHYARGMIQEVEIT